MIPFYTKLDACILNGCVEADHDRVGFNEDVTCAGGNIPIVGMFAQGLTIGTFPNFLVHKENECFPLYLAPTLQYY